MQRSSCHSFGMYNSEVFLENVWSEKKLKLKVYLCVTWRQMGEWQFSCTYSCHRH